MRSRKNMAIKLSRPEGNYTFDTIDEYEAWARSSSSPPTVAAEKPPSPRYRISETAPITPDQAKVIGFSVGPKTKELAGGQEATMTHREALHKLGVTSAIASKIIDEMVRAKVARFHRGAPYSDRGFSVALEILIKHLPAKKNPYGYVSPTEPWAGDDFGYVSPTEPWR